MAIKGIEGTMQEDIVYIKEWNLRKFLLQVYYETIKIHYFGIWYLENWFSYMCDILKRPMRKWKGIDQVGGNLSWY